MSAFTVVPLQGSLEPDRTLGSNNASKSTLANLILESPLPLLAKCQMILASIGVKMPYLSEWAASLRKSAAVILPSLDFAVASRMILSTWSISAQIANDNVQRGPNAPNLACTGPTSDDIVKRNDLGITNLLPRTQRTQRRQPFQDGVRQLVPGELEHDPLELFRLDVPVPVLVEISERLTQTFSLETLDELGEFGIC